jgi:hypothetical protein
MIRNLEYFYAATDHDGHFAAGAPPICPPRASHRTAELKTWRNPAPK